MDEAKDTENVLTIEIYQGEKNAFICYKDSGLGIEQEKLEGILVQGFTAKKDGHGFGLHSCANDMTEVGGRMWAESDGLGKGAKFILSFPLTGSDIANKPIHRIRKI